MIGILSTGVADASDQSDEAISVINRTETALLELSERGITRGFEDIPQIVRESFGTIDAIWRHKREVTGLATHYKSSTR